MPCTTPPWIWPSTMPGLQHVAAIVRDDPAQDLDRAGLRIHLEHDRVRAVREARLRHLEEVVGFEAAGLAGHGARVRGARDLAPTSPRGSAARARRTRRSRSTTSAGGRLQQVRGDARRLLAHDAAGEQRGAAADRRRPAAVRAAALRDERGVARAHVDRVGIDAEDRRRPGARTS